MTRSLICGMLGLCLVVFTGKPVLAQLAPLPAESDATPSELPAVSGELPEVKLPGGDQPEPFKLPPELQVEADKAAVAFKKSWAELEQVIGELRDVQVRFLNGERVSQADKDRYRQQRDLVRKTMNETYTDALEVFRYMPDEVAAQFIATMVQHRAERDIYNVTTLEGGARLIDAGIRYLYIFQAAARSAVAVGDFETAQRLYDAIDPESLEDIDKALLSHFEQLEANHQAEAAIRAKEEAEDRLPRVKLTTTRGEVVLELFLDQAPTTVANFIQLVEDGFYDGLDFYQVIDHLLALTGDPSGVGTGNAGRFLVDEHMRPDARKALRGSLVMAKVPEGTSGKFVPHSASSQFAILFLPQTSVTNEQTVFGRVIEGMDVISSLRRVDPNKKKKKTEVVLPPDRILTAEVIRRPETLPEPEYAQLEMIR